MLALAGLTMLGLSLASWAAGIGEPVVTDRPAASTAPAVTPRPDRLDPPADLDPTTSPATEPATEAVLPLAGRIVVLDPGHNGANADARATITAQVPDGRGGTKDCNTTGTATDDGYPEHAFVWDVAQRARSGLRALGAVVVLTRESDDGVGPCVDVRGELPGDVDADLMVSLHGDGSTDPEERGFFAIVSDPPLNDSQQVPSAALAHAILDALADEGFTPNPTYPQGLSRRADIAGLNHATRPATLVELGEMRNAEEAAVMMTEAGRQRYADAVVAGIAEWLAQYPKP